MRAKFHKGAFMISFSTLSKWYIVICERDEMPPIVIKVLAISADDAKKRTITRGYSFIRYVGLVDSISHEYEIKYI